METSDSSDESELELPRSMIKENKKRLSTKKCLKQTINKVRNKLEGEHERCSARKKRKQHGVNSQCQRRDKKWQHAEHEEGEISSSPTGSSSSSSNSASSESDWSSDDERVMVPELRKVNQKQCMLVNLK